MDCRRPQGAIVHCQRKCGIYSVEPHRSQCCTLFHPTLKRFLMGPSEASTLGCTAEPAWPLWYGASDASRWNGGTAARPPPPPRACCCCCCCCCAGGGRPPDGCAAGAAERSRAVYSCAFGGDSASADPARLSSPLPVERTRQHYLSRKNAECGDAGLS